MTLIEGYSRILSELHEAVDQKRCSAQYEVGVCILGKTEYCSGMMRCRTLSARGFLPSIRQRAGSPSCRGHQPRGRTRGWALNSRHRINHVLCIILSVSASGNINKREVPAAFNNSAHRRLRPFVPWSRTGVNVSAAAWTPAAGRATRENKFPVRPTRFCSSS